MPQNGYDGPITLAAGVTRLVTALQAAGYTGRFGFTRANLLNLTGATIYFARRSDVDASNGRPIEDAESHSFSSGNPGTVDFNKMYVFSAAGGTADFSGETR
jgi:hypothetical protein